MVKEKKSSDGKKAMASRHNYDGIEWGWAGVERRRLRWVAGAARRRGDRLGAGCQHAFGSLSIPMGSSVFGGRAGSRGALGSSFYLEKTWIEQKRN